MSELDPDIEWPARLEAAAQWLLRLEDAAQCKGEAELLLRWAQWSADQRNRRAHEAITALLRVLRTPEIRTWAQAFMLEGPAGVLNAPDGCTDRTGMGLAPRRTRLER